MTQDEIIEMARQADVIQGFNSVHPSIERFAKLVAQREREKFCAVLRQVHDSYSLASDPSGLRARGQA